MPEYVQFAGAMVLFVAILIGSYWFVSYSPESTDRCRDEGERGAE